MSEVGWRPIRRIASKIGANVRLADKTIELSNGGTISIRSADKPDSLRGEGLDLVVMDECAFVKEDAWTEALRPALADRLGNAIFIGTPKGRNWFWRLWQLGQQNSQDYQSWRFTTYDNPYIQPSEIDAAKGTLPERVFLQEFMAEFVEDSGSVFRGVMDCATSTELEQPIAGHSYIIGVDWGKSNDFTVISVIDNTTKRQVHLDRFNKIDYRFQIGRMESIVNTFNPVAIVAERNAMGEPLVEELFARDWPIQPFTTSNASKAAIIEGLALAIERQEIEILPDPVQTSELQAYELERLPSGLMRYNAPSGMHDDTVMALAMALYGASQEVEVINLGDMLG